MKFLHTYKFYCLGFYCIIIILHFYIKDALFPLSILFYMLPLILIISMGIILIPYFLKHKIIAFGLVLSTIALCFYWVNNYYFVQIHKTTSEPNETILFWNIAKQDKLPIAILKQHIKIHNPECMAFVEAKDITPNKIQTLKTNFPNYHFKYLKGNMLIASKGIILSSKFIDLLGHSTLNLITYKVNKDIRKLSLVDITANVFINKSTPLKRVLDISKTNASDIIVGDFNTPYESINFEPYFKDYSSFHNYSNGFTATWPYCIPLLEIDQIWVNKRYSPINLEKSLHSFSDHKLLIAKFQIK